MGNGEITCVDGVEVDSCRAGAGEDEICDNQDNDCDGFVDDGIEPVDKRFAAGMLALLGTDMTVKQRGVKTYPLKVKRLGATKFKVTVKARRSGRKGRLAIVVDGTDVGGEEQSQRFVLTVR